MNATSAPDRSGVTLSRIDVYPIKSLDGVTVPQAVIGVGGALRWDRAFAIADAQGKLATAKRFKAFHQLRATFADDFSCVGLQGPADAQTRPFALRMGNAELDAYLSEYFQQPLHLVEREGGYPDSEVTTGPTVVSQQTLAVVAAWYPGLSADDLRQRMRANLTLDAPTPFWEDHLVDDLEHVVAWRAGDVALEGVSACGRCVVPTRDPLTGESYSGFQHTFMERRAATLPPTVKRARFDHVFRLTVRCRVAQDQWGRELAVGQPVQRLGVRGL